MPSPLDPPDQTEITWAGSRAAKLTDIAGTQSDSTSVTTLKLRFENGETEVLSCDDVAIEKLIAVLKAIVPRFKAIAAASELPVSVNVEMKQTSASSSTE
jgi:hypothetical protein